MDIKKQSTRQLIQIVEIWYTADSTMITIHHINILCAVYDKPLEKIFQSKLHYYIHLMASFPGQPG